MVIAREEAGLEVVEDLVEGRTRDPGALDHVDDARFPVAALGHGLDHRLDQPRPLGFDDLCARETVPTARQLLGGPLVFYCWLWSQGFDLTQK